MNQGTGGPDDMNSAIKAEADDDALVNPDDMATGTLDEGQNMYHTAPMKNMFNNPSSKGTIAQHLSKKGKKGRKGKKPGAYVMSSQTANILKNNFLK